MALIKEHFGGLITKACKLSSVPPEFLAALIANESNGDPDASRFEKHVFKKLVEVREGTRKNYSTIHREHLVSLNDDALRLLATSYGPTQIMGYNAVLRHVDPLELNKPETAIHLTLQMLAECARNCGLDVQADFEEMLRWWNTGSPYDDPKTERVEGVTHDPNYVPNALRRMKVYKTL